MTDITRRQYTIFGAITLAVLSLGWGVVQTYYDSWVYPPAFVVLNPPKPGEGNNESHYAHQIERDDGDARPWIVIGREFQITREVRIRVTRELMLAHTSQEVAARSPVRDENYKVQRRKELDSSFVQYHPGFYRNERDLKLPLVPPGTYSILNVVCWPANYRREDCVDLPEVTVEIKEKAK